MKLLLVEDNPADARWVREVLADAGGGVDLIHAASLVAALSALARESFDAILLDPGLPDSENSAQALDRMLAAGGGAAIVVLTGMDDDAAGDAAMQAGAQAYLVKGQFDGCFLLRTLRHATERQRLYTRLAREVALREQAQAALEEANDALEMRVRDRTTELRQVNRALSMIGQCNRSLLRARDERTLLDEVCRLVVDIGGYPFAWVGYVRDGACKTLSPAASAGEDSGYLDALNQSRTDEEWGSGLACTSIRTGRIVVERDITAGKHYFPAHGAAIQSGFKGAVALPLHVEGRVLGTLVVYSSSAHVFEGRELELLEELAADLSFGIETLRGQTARREAEAKTRLLSSAIEQTADLVSITDRNGVIQYVNAAFERVTGYTFDEAAGKKTSILNSGMQTIEFYERLWQTIKGGQPFRGTFINRRKDGSLYYEQKTITPIIKDERGEITHFLSTGKDITDQVAVEDRLRRVIQYDPVTELPNRGLFLDRVRRLIETDESRGRTAAVLVLNLDRFKIVNDSLGHEAGNALLWAAARLMLECIRPGDTVARLEADSFAVLLSDINTVDDVAPLVDKLLAGFAKPFMIGGEELYVTASLGVSVWPGDGDTADALLQNAVVAVNRAKQRGRARCEYYESAMNAHAAKRIALETGLRHALERREFVLHYQPKVDLLTERIVGVEALLRWQHPEQGLIPPVEFIPLLEETGLIVPVGRWALETACAQYQAWAVQGGESLVLAVNLSAHQFAQGDVVQVVRETLAKCGCTTASDWLELEITESAVMKDMEHTASALQQLKELGIRIAIDDFGTGHSSLSYLTRLPLDVLKIDRSFVTPLPHSRQDGEVVRAIIALAGSLHLVVVAEGVETAEQQAFLLEQGCACAQGYYFARPLPAEQITPLLSGMARPARG